MILIIVKNKNNDPSKIVLHYFRQINLQIYKLDAEFRAGILANFQAQMVLQNHSKV